MAFIGGIFSAWLVRGISKEFLILFLVSAVVAALACLSIGWSAPLAKTAGCLILFFVLGFWRFGLGPKSWADCEIARFNDQPARTFRALVVREPDVREQQTKLTVEAQKGYCGKVLVTVPPYPAYRYGDVVQISCALQTPKEYPDFSYKNYLARFEIYAVCYPRLGEMRQIAAGQGNPIYAAVFAIKNHTQRTINAILGEPQASLLAGILLGAQRGIPPSLREQFAQVGIAHIIAISGQNITLLAALVMSALISAGLWRQQAFYLATFFLVFYILLVGAPASAVRAGIMGFSVLLAIHAGRLAHSVNAIIFAAAVMLLFRPVLLIWDVGFQLSFAAALGIIFVYPFLARWCARWPEILMVKQALLLTIAAQVSTWPLISYHFGTISLVAPLANILIVPLLPLIMVFGFLSIAAGMVYWLLGWLLGWFVFLPLTFILTVSDYLARIPLGFLAIKIQWWMVLIYYVVLIASFVWLSRRREFGPDAATAWGIGKSASGRKINNTLC